MADNTTLNPGVGGDLIATDDIAGVKWQWVKNAFGGDGAVVPVDRADGAGMPVQAAPGSTTTGTLQANGDTIVVPLLGAPSVYFSFVNSAFTGTVAAEGSLDGGVTYNGLLVWQVGASANFGGGVVPTNANITMASTPGLTHFRVRVTAYTSGSCVGTFRTSSVASVVSVLNGSVGNLAGTSTLTPGGGAANLGKAEDAVHTSGDVGVLSLGVRNDAEANTTSASGDYSQIATDAAGRVIVTPKTTGFASGSLHRVLSANSVNATNVKSAQGNVYSIVISNMNLTTIRFVKFYNKASAPVVGTDVPVATILVPPLQTITVPLATPMGFSAGIGYGMTTLVADSDTTAVAAAEVAMTIGFA